MNCPTCNKPMPTYVDDVTYCSEECHARGEGLRLCPCCDSYQPGESFQPALRPQPGIRSFVEALLCLPPPPVVCEICAETCVACEGRGDVERLDEHGRCPGCQVPCFDAYEGRLRQGLDPYEGQL